MSNFCAMRNLNKLVASLMVAALIAAAFFATSPNAKAAEGSVTLNGSPLSIVAPPSNFTFTGVTLDGLSAKPTTGSFTVGVNDPSGTNEGWNLTAVMTDLTDGTHTLPAPTIDSAANIAAVDTNGATAANNTAAYPYTFGADNTQPFLNAAVNTGQGSHSYTVTTNLIVPKNSYVGTYKATLTVTLAAGPA